MASRPPEGGFLNQPIPLLYTIPNFDTAGSGAALLSVVARLDRRRFAPSICVLRRGGRLEGEVERLGVPLLEGEFRIGARPLITLRRRAREAAEAFRGKRFALWHSYHYIDDYTEPLVARASGASAWVYTKKNMSWNRRWYLRSLLATRIAAQNRDMIQQFFGRPMLGGRATRIPPGVETERFRPDVPARLGLRAQLGVSSDEIVVGCVAQLVPVKGHRTLIRALAALPGVRLWLAGREDVPEYASQLRRDVADFGLENRVAFLGEIRDVPAFLAELDVFVLPTWDEWRMEGCPVALLEAMSSGRACVASDIPGSRDAVQNGQSGVLVPPRDPDALAEAIDRLGHDAGQRRALGQAARTRVVDLFSIESEVQALEKLYSEALRLPETAAT